MQIKPIKTRIFKEDEDLIAFITSHIKTIKEGSVLVITSKIVALSEGRTRVVKSKKEKEQIIKEESQFALKTKWAWLTIKDNIVMASAGIDESNAKGKLILLPENSFDTAHLLHQKLKKIYNIKKLGIIITDSRTEPLRLGVTGKSVGYAGFEGLKSYIGKKDLFGRLFHFSRVSVADSLASGAVFEMGEGNECKPLCVIEDTHIIFTNRKIDPKALTIPLKDDMYAPLFRQKINLKKK